MNPKNKSLLSLIIWMVTLVAIGSAIGSLTKPAITIWYSSLIRSSLTPPNYVFPFVWTILYSMIGAGGWLIWHAQLFPTLNIIKTLYVAQLILNWSWPFSFFVYHLTGLSLIILGIMNILVGALIILAYREMRAVSLIMIPYLCWIAFASYLNFYIWHYNCG